jgi:hypothetical protein
MENKFKYDLRFNENTPELRKKLEDLGYWYLQNGYDEWYIPIEDCPYLTTDRRGFYKGSMAAWNDGHKDCETEEQFLELAKIMED